jgi:succinate dehydrogenase / fumarate reductase iron-sulfur subunit
VSVDAGTAPDADTVQIPQHVAEPHWTSPPALAAVPALAACPNGSGSLFTGAKLGHLSLRPHGRQERERRAQSIGAQANEEFGYCTLFGECTQVCPAGIPITAVAALNHERLRNWARRYQVRDNARRSKREHPRRGDE